MDRTLTHKGYRSNAAGMFISNEPVSDDSVKRNFKKVIRIDLDDCQSLELVFHGETISLEDYICSIVEKHYSVLKNSLLVDSSLVERLITRGGKNAAVKKKENK